MKKDQIIAALPLLNEADLKAISAVLSSLLGNGASATPTPVEGPQAWLFVAIQSILNGVYQPPSSLKGFHSNSVIFIEFVKVNFPAALNKKIVGIAVMKQLVSLIADDLRDKKVPVTWGTLVQNLSRIPSVFDAAFPGYIESKITGLLMGTHRPDA